MSPDKDNHLKLKLFQKVYRNWSKRQHFISGNVLSFLCQKIKLVDSKWTFLASVNHGNKALQEGNMRTQRCLVLPTLGPFSFLPHA